MLACSSISFVFVLTAVVVVAAIIFLFKRK